MKNKNIFGIVIAAVFLFWALWNYEVSLAAAEKTISILMPFIIGCSIAFIVNVLLEKIEFIWDRFLKNASWAEYVKRPVCIVISVLIITGIGGLTLFLVVPELHASIKALAKAIPPALIQLNDYLQQKIAELHLSNDDIAYVTRQWKEIYTSWINFLKNNKGTLLSGTWNAATSFVYMTADIVIGVVVAVYILLEKEFLAKSIRRALYAFCSKDNAEYLIAAGAASKRIFSGYVAGQVSEAVILGLMCFAGMLILGLPYALVISVLVAVMALIPILGTFISAVVGCFLTLMAAPDKILWFILFFFVLQRIEGDILYPKIVGKAVGLSELYVLVAITIGGSIGGIIGIIISVPIFSVLYFLFSQKVQQLLDDKNMKDI